MSRTLKTAGVVTVLTVTTLIVSCNGPDESTTPPTLPLGMPQAPPSPDLNQEKIELGENLYQQNCASCHRADLSGDPNWKTPNDDGSYPPPPHDSTGHTWHHSDQLLLELVRDGSDFPQTRMPSFADTLSDDQIIAILEFIKSQWGPQEQAYQWQITWQESRP